VFLHRNWKCRFSAGGLFNPVLDSVFAEVSLSAFCKKYVKILIKQTVKILKIKVVLLCGLTKKIYALFFLSMDKRLTVWQICHKMGGRDCLPSPPPVIYF